MKTLAAFGVAFGVLLSPAFAVHGTVGTWEITWKMNAGAVGGVERFCMNLHDVGSDEPPMSLTGLCRPVNHSMPGNTFSSEVICRRPAGGRGTVFIEFTSPTRYHGHQNVTITLAGRTMTNRIVFDAHWVSANCTAQPMTRN